MSKEEIRNLMIIAGCPGVPDEDILWCWSKEALLELLNSQILRVEAVKALIDYPPTLTAGRAVVTGWLEE